MSFSLGSGISIRSEFLPELAQRVARGDSSVLSKIGWVEVVPENFMGRGGSSRRALLEVAEALPMVFHSVSLSIGGIDPLNMDFLSLLRALAREARVRWYSDHLSFSSAEGYDFQNLLPIPFTHEVVQYVVDRIKIVQDYLEIPFAVENPSTYLVCPESEMTETQFISEVLERANCKLLLDVNNIFVNSLNRAPGGAVNSEQAIESAIRESEKFLAQIPLDRIMEVHVAGHSWETVDNKPLVIDTHGAPAPEPVQRILKALHAMSPVKNILLEREANIPPLDEILNEVASLRRLLSPVSIPLSGRRKSPSSKDRTPEVLI